MKSYLTFWSIILAMVVGVLSNPIDTPSQVDNILTWRFEPDDTTAGDREAVTIYCEATLNNSNTDLPEWYKKIPYIYSVILETETGYNFSCRYVPDNKINGLHLETSEFEDPFYVMSPRTIMDHDKTITVHDMISYHRKFGIEYLGRGSTARKKNHNYLLECFRYGTFRTVHDHLPDLYREVQDESIDHGNRSYCPKFYKITRPTGGQSELVMKSDNKRGIWTIRTNPTLNIHTITMSATLVVLDKEKRFVKVSGVGPTGEVIIGSTVEFELHCSIDSRTADSENLMWTSKKIDTDKTSLIQLNTANIINEGVHFNCRLNHRTTHHQWACDEDVIFKECWHRHCWQVRISALVGEASTTGKTTSCAMKRAVVRVFSLASVTPVDTTIASSASSSVNEDTVTVAHIVELFVAVVVVIILGPCIKELIGGNVIIVKTERDPNTAGKHLHPKNNQNQSGIDPFWQFMCKIAQRIGDDSFLDMKTLCTTSSGNSMLTKQQCENISRPLNLFEALKEAGHFDESNRSTVVVLLETVNLNSLADDVNNWS